MELSSNKILITGGASGIGLGLTERFLLENNTVIICGRRAEVLKEVTDKHPQVISRVCDLSAEAERIALYEWLAAEHIDVNVLVNNAGVQNWMGIDDEDFYTKASGEIETNIVAPLHLISLLIKLPNLKTIMNVTSGLAFVQLAKVPVYCATKAFFRSFTLSLRYLLQPKGMEVIEIIPPALNTDLGGKGIHDGSPSVGDFVEAIFAQLKEGKNELTFGFSEAMLKATPETLAATFAKMNPEYKV
ncbi:SDR family oxidoreductase [Dyadobacter sp. CY326]|uniref:SDR family oxidoreductase n=1 Tax=Dyadobacter sp. CY326 TaxID=2907300 RepID=UPI001F1A5DDE|nr:SDR family NAD(P)-dependent oxidoreductase [Dyadobacter sp. CY326]MCE7065771.1 SDR family NAD(P)-dependent oxidoreductase [Dyadobacter sp. CY326]